jgi:hypothetical protein
VWVGVRGVRWEGVKGGNEQRYMVGQEDAWRHLLSVLFREIVEAVGAGKVHLFQRIPVKSVFG